MYDIAPRFLSSMTALLLTIMLAALVESVSIRSTSYPVACVPAPLQNQEFTRACCCQLHFAQRPHHLTAAHHSVFSSPSTSSLFLRPHTNLLGSRTAYLTLVAPTLLPKGPICSAYPPTNTPNTSAMAPPPPGQTAQQRLIALVQTLQFAWFAGHVTLLLCTMRYGLSYITFNSASRFARFSYRTAFLAAAVTYGIVVFKGYRARAKSGKGQGSPLQLIGDENVQYLGESSMKRDPLRFRAEFLEMV